MSEERKKSCDVTTGRSSAFQVERGSVRIRFRRMVDGRLTETSVRIVSCEAGEPHTADTGRLHAPFPPGELPPGGEARFDDLLPVTYEAWYAYIWVI